MPLAPITGINDVPLEFNLKKINNVGGSCPMDLEERDQQRNRRSTSTSADRDRHDDSNNSVDTTDRNGPMLSSNAFSQHQNDLMFNSLMGQMPQSLMMVPGMMNMNMMDPSLLQFPMMGQMSSTIHQQQQPDHQGSTAVKEVITCKSCTLFPPNPNAPLPTTRERPPGCRTVFVV